VGSTQPIERRLFAIISSAFPQMLNFIFS